MDEPATQFQVTALQYRKLTSEALTQLAAAQLSAEDEISRSELFRRDSAPIDDVAVIDKCNAIIVVTTFSEPTDEQFARDLVLRRWLDLAPGLGPCLSRIENHHGSRAVEFLGEVAVGLHSVVLGDSQVYSQVVAGLSEARTAGAQASPFSMLARRLRPLLHAVRSTTALQQGNVSLERVACSRISQAESVRSVAVVGFGRTGQLIAAILGKETTYNVLGCNRTPGKAQGVQTVEWDNLEGIAAADAIVLCLKSVPETLAYTEKLFGHLTERHLVVDLSSPSISRQLSTGTAADVVGIDQLADDTASNLAVRKQAVNKARQIIGEWAGDVTSQLASSSRVVAWHQATDPEAAVHRAHILQEWRAQLASEGFTEIQTPCMVPSDVITVGLTPRRSAQFHHQLAVLGGMEKIYEIGPVWDGDESMVLQVEVRSPAALIDLVHRAVDLIRSAVPMPDRPTVTLDYGKAIDRLAEAGHQLSHGVELRFVHRYLLNDLIGERVFVIIHHPASRRLFTAARSTVPGRASTFEVVLDGHRVCHGGLHESAPDELRKQVALAGLPAQRFDSFIAHFGQAPPHGGFELSLDRLITSQEQRNHR